MSQQIDHPTHYNQSGIHYPKAECIQIVRNLSFSLGNAVKYVWRMGLKDDPSDDAKKAAWYTDDAFVFSRFTGMEEQALGILSAMEGNSECDIEKLSLIHDLIDLHMETAGKTIDGRLNRIKSRISRLAEKLSSAEAGAFKRPIDWSAPLTPEYKGGISLDEEGGVVEQ